MKRIHNRLLCFSIVSMLGIGVFATAITVQASGHTSPNAVGIGFGTATTATTATTAPGGSGGGTTATSTATTATSTATTSTSTSTGSTGTDNTSTGSGSTSDPLEPNPNPSVPTAVDKAHKSTSKPNGRVPVTGDARSLTQFITIMVVTFVLGVFLFILLQRRKEEDQLSL